MHKSVGVLYCQLVISDLKSYINEKRYVLADEKYLLGGKFMH